MIWLWLAACSGGQPDCVDVEPECNLAYEATFDNLYERTLQPGCGVGGGSCHAADGARGGLVIDNPDDAHAALVVRLVPGDGSCSEVVVRTHVAGTSYSMPPGSPLTAEEQCVILTWIQEGAAR